MRHLLTINDLGRDGVEEILDVAESFVDVIDRPSPKVPALRGKTILNLFFESSTRTRTSFELAGKLLSADVINFTGSGSSLDKGESLRDTIEAVSAMGFDALVVRHGSSGVPLQITRWTQASVINAGDGAHQHPTQGLLDALTLRQRLKRNSFENVRMAIVGDVAHSRVTRSAVDVFTLLGAEITLVGPPTLVPANTAQWPVTISHDLDEVLTKVDVIYTIRPQKERITEALLPSMDEYINRYSITDDRFARLEEHVVLLESGPLVRGVQMSNDVADSERNLMTHQVRNGVATRMAVLFMLLQETPETRGERTPDTAGVSAVPILSSSPGDNATEDD